ncbi:sodium-dependent lysophosphatidylcholine symporter 1 isoform X2 [Acanthopagrus latus]|uniref:sodium-dependent lysophosphatidylcholine symporter 1 isoform X2 n=1 Tax=Acanthopagrus latus TaxID=8177 RepID=UPI00187C6A61|nr:sodium-dependent lysophosphatidylcholine symporter 1 isoform X2 [Acanthopagrus latus]
MSCLKDFTSRVQTLKNQLLKQAEDRESCSAGQQRGSGGIPLARKMCYAVGGVPYQMTTVALGVSLQIFLLDVVQMEASYVSMILFVSRAWDAVTDPLIGYLVGRSNWTPIGKLTPWLVLSSPFGVLSYLLLWFVPGGSMSPAVRVLWFLTAACLFETIMSCYNVPYISLNMFLGGDHRDRDSATAYRMTVEMVAMLLASVIQGQVVAVYNTEKQEACQHADQETPQSTSSAQNASLQGTQKAFLTSALVMGALFFLCSLVLFLGVTEQRAALCSDDRVRPPYLTSLKMLMCHIPYQRLLLGFVFSALAFQMSLGNFALFCSHAAGLGAHFQHLLLALLLSASVAVPLWQTVLLRIGKKVTVFIGLSLFIPASIIVACVPSNLPVFMIMCILMGFSIATVFLLPWSMLPDVVDDFAARHPSYKDLEPLFFSCYAFCSKLAGGLSVGISTMTLHTEATSSSSETREHNSERPTNVQPPRDDVTTTSHSNTKTNATSHQSKSSPRCYKHDKKCSVKSSVPSDVSQSCSGEYSGPKSVVKSDVNLKRHEQRLSRYPQPGEDKSGRNVPENDPGTSSSRSNVKSKVSWV